MRLPGGKPKRVLWIADAGDPLDEGYYHKVAALVSGTQPGRVTHISIRHDSWCPKLRTGGPCRCEADVDVAPAPQADQHTNDEGNN
jgi:hypothetical protein